MNTNEEKFYNNCFTEIEEGRNRFYSDCYGTGRNQPHNNMPPYLAVYVWKIIA